MVQLPKKAHQWLWIVLFVLASVLLLAGPLIYISVFLESKVQVLEKASANSIGMTLVHIPAGDFLMSSPHNEIDRAIMEGEQHRVKITKSFHMGVHEVTVGQFEKFVEATGYQTEAEKEGKGSSRLFPDGWKLDPQTNWRNPGWVQSKDYPVVCVSWNDAREFCEWLSKKEGKIYRLPTSAEWEYACRAGTKTPFHYGKTLSSDQANFDGWVPYGKAKQGPKTGRACAVGSYFPNAFGLYDMHGNVWEWCLDGRREYQKVKQPLEDPMGDLSGEYRLLRGGSWNDGGFLCRAALYLYFPPSERINYFGFRVVREQ